MRERVREGGIGGMGWVEGRSGEGKAWEGERERAKVTNNQFFKELYFNNSSATYVQFLSQLHNGELAIGPYHVDVNDIPQTDTVASHTNVSVFLSEPRSNVASQNQ